MPSQRFRRELAQELPTWREKGWLSQQAAEELTRAYDLDRPTVSLASVLRAIFGAALLVGGLVLVLAHNWDELPRWLRLACALLPLAATVSLTAWRFARHEESRAWSEALGLANSLAVALSISLVAQIYHISGDLPSFLLTWAMLTLPAALLLESGCAWVLFQVLATIWAYQVSRNLALPGYVAMVLPSCIVFLREVWGTRRPDLCNAIITPFLITATIAQGALLRGSHNETWFQLAFTAWFGCVYAAISEAGLLRTNFHRYSSAVGLAIMLLILGYERNWRHLDLPAFTHNGDHWVAIGGLTWIILLHIGLLVLTLANRRHMDLAGWCWCLAGFSTLAACAASQLGLPAYAGGIIANLVTAALAVLTMRSGIRQMDTLRLNLGWLLLSTLVLLRFFDTGFSYLGRGLAFIAFGLGFLAINAWLHRHRKEKATGKSSAVANANNKANGSPSPHRPPEPPSPGRAQATETGEEAAS